MTETTTVQVVATSEATSLAVGPAETVVVVSDTPTETVIIAAADIGPRGAQGSPGPPGAAGADGADGTPGSYMHVQGSTSDTWVVAHNLGYFPAITVVDSGGTTVIGEVTHDSPNQATVRFASAFSGTAYAS